MVDHRRDMVSIPDQEDPRRIIDKLVHHNYPGPAALSTENHNYCTPYRPCAPFEVALLAATRDSPCTCKIMHNKKSINKLLKINRNKYPSLKTYSNIDLEW